MRGAENNDFFGEHPLQPRERVYDWQGVDDVSIDNTIDIHLETQWLRSVQLWNSSRQTISRPTPPPLLCSIDAACAGAGAAARPQDGEGRDGEDEGDGGHLQRGRRGGPPGDQPEHALGHVTTLLTSDWLSRPGTGSRGPGWRSSTPARGSSPAWSTPSTTSSQYCLLSVLLSGFSSFSLALWCWQPRPHNILYSEWIRTKHNYTCRSLKVLTGHNTNFTNISRNSQHSAQRYLLKNISLSVSTRHKYKQFNKNTFCGVTETFCKY